MRWKLALLLFFCVSWLISIHAQTENSFPLHLVIESSSEPDLGISAEQLAEAAADGDSPPGFVIFRGTINGERHWTFTCRKENKLREINPCTKIPAGEYRARWVHNYGMLELLDDSQNLVPSTRFLIVDQDRKNPAPDNDPVFDSPIVEFPANFPSGKGIKDYPLLLHVYGGSVLDLTVGTLPARTNCSAQVWSSTMATTRCSQLPAREIHRGYVSVDLSAGNELYASMTCEAKWRWSHCSVIDPGFYYAKIDKNRIVVLSQGQDGKAKEIGFEIKAKPQNHTLVMTK